MADKAKDEQRTALKERLYRYRQTAQEVHQLMAQIERLEQMARHGVSAQAGLLIAGLRQQYKRQVDATVAEQTAIECLLSGLEPVERRLMRYRYIEGMTWEQVCVAMSYSWRQTHNLHSRAIDRLLTAEKKKGEK